MKKPNIEFNVFRSLASGSWHYEVALDGAVEATGNGYVTEENALNAAKEQVERIHDRLRREREIAEQDAESEAAEAALRSVVERRIHRIWDDVNSFYMPLTFKDKGKTAWPEPRLIVAWTFSMSGPKRKARERIAEGLYFDAWVGDAQVAALLPVAVFEPGGDAQTVEYLRTFAERKSTTVGHFAYRSGGIYVPQGQVLSVRLSQEDPRITEHEQQSTDIYVHVHTLAAKKVTP